MISVPKHIENIRNVLKTRIDDLVDLFDVSDKTIFEWMSGDSLPEIEKQELIVRLSKISDKFLESNVSRPDLLFKMKAFNGKSLMDLARSDEATGKHVDALVEEAGIMKRAYQESGLANSKTAPTDDWKSSISIAGTIGNY